MTAKKDEEISDLKARLNILENDNTVDGVEQPQSSTQEPPPLVPALQPKVVSNSESDDGDEETDPLVNPLENFTCQMKKIKKY